MKVLTITALALSQWRAHGQFQRHFDSSDVAIYGDNALGKTSIGDAIMWLLTGKNLAGSTQFDIKTWGVKQGKHEVDISFLWDGEELCLRRAYKEEWGTVKGRTEAEFKGHKTFYFIDGVPKDEAPYNEFLKTIATPKQFEILMRDDAFMSLHWTERRSMLIEAFGDVSMETVCEANPGLADIPSILGKLSVDDKKAQLKEQRKPVFGEVQAIPERLAENRRMLPDEVPDPASVLPLREKLEALQKEKAQIEHGGAIAKKQIEARDIESRMKDAKADARRLASEATQEVRSSLFNLKSEVGGIETKLTQARQALTSGENALNELTQRRLVLLDEHRTLKEMAWTGDATCATCGQPLPAESVENAKAAFNRGVAERKEANMAAGKAVAADIAARTQALDELRAGLAQDENHLEERRIALRQAEETLKVKETAIPEFADDPKLVEALSKVVAEIEDLRQSSESEIQRLDDELAIVNADIAEIEASIARKGDRERMLSRVAELEASHKKHVRMLEDIDRQLALLDQFVAARIRMLETTINSHFELVTWKLFETQVNGGIKEICEPCFGDRPYSTSLSTSEQINAGLDIINAFARHWGLALPVIIDYGESVLHPLPTYGQQIRLIASINDKTLRVELLDRHETPATKEALAS